MGRQKHVQLHRLGYIVSVYNGDGDLNNVDRICVGTFLELYCQQELKQAVVVNVKTKHFYFHHQSNCYWAVGSVHGKILVRLSCML